MLGDRKTCSARDPPTGATPSPGRESGPGGPRREARRRRKDGVSASTRARNGPTAACSRPARRSRTWRRPSSSSAPAPWEHPLSPMTSGEACPHSSSTPCPASPRGDSAALPMPPRRSSTCWRAHARAATSCSVRSTGTRASAGSSTRAATASRAARVIPLARGRPRQRLGRRGAARHERARGARPRQLGRRAPRRGRRQRRRAAARHRAGR